jgi:hypothetical protein
VRISNHDWKRCSYGLKHDLDQRFYWTNFNGGNVPDLQNENGPGPGGELQITGHVSFLRFDYSPLQSELSALRKAITISMRYRSAHLSPDSFHAADLSCV